jgi:hypothetical protein
MTTGVVLFPNPRSSNLVDDVVAQASRAYDLGVRQVWLGQQHDHDAMALAALVGAAVPGLGVGTSVVPINPRHPLIVASLAQTDVRVSLARQTLPQWVQRNRSGGSFRATWTRVRPMWCSVRWPGPRPLQLRNSGLSPPRSDRRNGNVFHR